MLPLNEQAYNKLLSMIDSNYFRYNVYYSETRLSKEFNISRTPLRDALNKLAQEGYIDIVPSKGFCLHTLTPEDLLEMIQVRIALECFAAMEAAYQKDSRNTQELIRDLEDTIDTMKAVMKRNGTTEEFANVDFCFHRLLVDSLHNNQFHDLYRRYLNRIIRTAEITLEQEGRKEEVLKEHQSIIDAIKAGDQPASHKAVLKHLMITRQLNQDALANLQEQRTDGSLLSL
ncbi:MAG: GntR family transcriptional regulator [Erysipelotrichaceae bacterium]|nr:GntR family transcriptional regulator [Erysipelotrichaceae bacterium]